jgi:hypothetical protein
MDNNRKFTVKGTSPIGTDEFDTIKEINKAKNESEKKAGLIKTTSDGSVWDEDDIQLSKIPNESIHQFDDLEKCNCDCHPRKYDCMNCYDHPIHLDAKRKMTERPTDGYDEAKIMELIEKDKAKQSKKRWWQR